MDIGNTEKIDVKTRPNTIWKKWLIIAIVAILVILLAVPSVFALRLHNSAFDCSYNYSKVEDPLSEIARKHTYYMAAEKALEIELNQDMINSLIKDNLDSLNLQLPVTINELMFNTKDQRLYINSKYGNLNVPISVKLTVNISDDGLTFQGQDIKLGKMDAPGFVLNQINEDDLKYTVKYADFGLPPVFTIRDVVFGSGVVKVVIQLKGDEIVKLAMDYRNNLLTDINKFKSEQPELVNTFLSKLIGTEVLSDAKVKDYVDQVLGNEELVNSAIYFATADDLSKYTNALENTQKKLEEWTAPLQNIKISDNIDETVNNILYDQALRDMLSWFVAAETMNDVTMTVEEYYGMYKEYYGMYEDTLAYIDDLAAGIKTKEITDFRDSILNLTAQAEDARLLLKDGIQYLDDQAIADIVNMFEKDKRYTDGYIKDSIDARDAAKEFLDLSYSKEIDEFNSIIKGRSKFIIDLVNQLKNKQYEDAVLKIVDDGVIDKKTQAFVDKYSKEIDTETISYYLD